MFVPVACVKCDKPFQVPEAVAGTNVTCPWCKAIVPALPVAGLSTTDSPSTEPGGAPVPTAPLSPDDDPPATARPSRRVRPVRTHPRHFPFLTAARVLFLSVLAFGGT